MGSLPPRLPSVFRLTIPPQQAPSADARTNTREYGALQRVQQQQRIPRRLLDLRISTRYECKVSAPESCYVPPPSSITIAIVLVIRDQPFKASAEHVDPLTL